MFKFIMMISGYAESATVSPLIYQCNFFGIEGYSSYKKAITDLAQDLYYKYFADVLSAAIMAILKNAALNF